MPNIERIKNYSSEVKKCIKRAKALESNLKKAREKFFMEEVAHKTSNDATTKSNFEVDATQEELHRPCMI